MTGGGRLRAAWRLVRCVLHGLHGLTIVLWRFPRLDAAARHARIGWWSRGMLRRLGIELRVDGAFTPGAKLVAANHVSWLDILAVHALCPEARFVSKAEVRHWPLVSSLVASAGTLYLERERARDALRVVHDVAAALRAGETVAVFPEGTTGTGAELLAFHANLLQAAISTATPVQPVALRYADARHAVSPAAMWLEGTTLMGSLWKLAGADRLVLHIKVLEPVASAQRDRRAFAALLHARVGAALGF